MAGLKGCDNCSHYIWDEYEEYYLCCEWCGARTYEDDEYIVSNGIYCEHCWNAMQVEEV